VTGRKLFIDTYIFNDIHLTIPAVNAAKQRRVYRDDIKKDNSKSSIPIFAFEQERRNSLETIGI